MFLRWRLALSVIAGLAVLGGLAGAASANTDAYTLGINSTFAVDTANANCSGGNRISGNVGLGPSENPFQYTNGLTSFGSLPGGATLVGAILSGTYQLLQGAAGTYDIGFGDGSTPPVDALNCPNNSAGAASDVSVSFPSTGATETVTAPGYALASSMLQYPESDGSSPPYYWWTAWPVPGAFGSNTGTNAIGFSSNPTLTVQYAFTPTGIAVYRISAGSGTNAVVDWNANGNDAGTQYVLQRETIGSGGVTQGWTTIYQGTATSFSTTDQSCGNGYVYRVAATGPNAQTPWDTSSQWDAYPCSLTFGTAATTSVPISWPAVTASTDYV